jgi:integrase
MKTYKYRKRTTYDGVKIDVRADTKIELGQKLQKRIEQIKQGAVITRGNATVESWLLEYIEVYKRPAVSDSTYRDHMVIAKHWIIPNIGKLRLCDVKPTQCQNLINQAKHLSKRYIAKIKYLLAAAFDAAIDNQLMNTNPAKRLKLPKAYVGTRRAITDKEREALLYVCQSHDMGLWVLFMLFCGLRPHETTRVKGEHIDLKTNTLFVDGVKSKASKRYTPIPAYLVSRLTGLALPIGVAVFSYKGKPLNSSRMSRIWQSVKSEMSEYLGEPVASDFVPYCLRHTYCTDLQAAGVPINVAKELMGHSSIVMTANIYTHSSDVSFESAREMIERHQLKTGVAPKGVHFSVWN